MSDKGIFQGGSLGEIAIDFEKNGYRIFSQDAKMFLLRPAPRKRLGLGISAHNLINVKKSC